VQHRPLAVAEASPAQQRRAEEDYLVSVIRKLSRYRFMPQTQAASAHGLVVTKITLARDGHVLNVALSRSSGFAVLDQGVLDTIRRASPFEPLPDDITGTQVSLTVPIAYDRER
jgi:protein TonB